MGLKEDLLPDRGEDPQDMTPRLALADFLQEHGATETERAYGEYLALCRHLGRTVEGDHGRGEMQARRRALMERATARSGWDPWLNWATWSCVPTGWSATGYRMTFFTHDLPALLPAPEFACVAECVLRLVRERIRAPKVNTLATAPQLAHLTGLYLLDQRLDAGTLSPLLFSAHARRLVELRLGGNALGDVGAGAGVVAELAAADGPRPEP